MGDRVILHSDINCCYASIEHLHHPELAGKPLAVGGDPEARHGIVLTADYIAKKYGVKTGMALWQAKEVCPDITFVSPRMDLYLRFSRMAHERGLRIADRRKEMGLSQDELAHRAGIGRQALSAIENGGDFKTQTLDSLAIVLGVSVDFIMYGEKEEKSELLSEAMDVLSDMDELQIRQCLAMMKRSPLVDRQQKIIPVGTNKSRL